MTLFPYTTLFRSLPPVKTHRINFHSLARATNFYEIYRSPRMVPALPWFRGTLRGRVRQLDQLCDEAETILHRIESVMFTDEAQFPLDDALPLPTRPDAVTTVPYSNCTAETVCSICLCDFAAGSNLSSLPCGHVFHPDCVACWICDHPSCPVCRQSLS
jgi:hypothetical protein